MSLFNELKRRNVFKVAAAYLIVSWLILQIIGSIVPIIEAPEWISKAILMLLLAGFPIALLFAWAFELTPEGIKKESEISPEESVASHTGRKLDYLVIALLVLTAGYFIYESRFKSSQVSETEGASQPPNKQETLAESVKLEGSSIAVLPFVNMSNDPDNEYFSDGISEEILNVLAKVPNLHVTSRSSAFSFKGKEIIISEVATKLGVVNVLEGSVRKSGNRIRITAQLIEAATDTHLWSESYDRELTDIFAVQDEISAAIVTALKNKLGLDTHVVERDMSGINLDAHNEYLKGRFFIENRNKADIEKALTHFNRAIEISPDYAKAWMGKGWASLLLGETNYGDTPFDVAINNAKNAVEKALELDSDLAEAYAIMGQVESEFSNSKKAIALFEKAIKINPNYADVRVWLSTELFNKPKEAQIQIEKALQLNPMSMLVNGNYAYRLSINGRTAEARKVVEQMLAINESNHLPHQALANILLIESKYAESIFIFESVIQMVPDYVNLRVRTATLLSTLGLKDKVGMLLDGTPANTYQYRLKGNDDLYISGVRKIYPRNENDLVGDLIRAEAEAWTQNYTEAVKYFSLHKYPFPDNYIIYSLQQTGQFKIAQELLQNEKLILQRWLEADIKHYSIKPIQLRQMELAYLDGDVEQAMEHLEQAMQGSYILSFDYKKNPMYKKLREHSKWPNILKESNKRAAVQREIYLRL